MLCKYITHYLCCSGFSVWGRLCFPVSLSLNLLMHMCVFWWYVCGKNKREILGTAAVMHCDAFFSKRTDAESTCFLFPWKSHLSTVICVTCAVCLHCFYLIWSHWRNTGNLAMQERKVTTSIVGTLIFTTWLCLFIHFCVSIYVTGSIQSYWSQATIKYKGINQESCSWWKKGVCMLFLTYTLC